MAVQCCNCGRYGNSIFCDDCRRNDKIESLEKENKDLKNQIEDLAKQLKDLQNQEK